jgi:hypothetical protein
VIIARYADDFVMGFQYADDTRRMRADLGERMAKFGLKLHEEKTRLIEFGRLPTLDHARRGERRPKTFAFLGFTHYCGRTRDGRFVVKRKTQSKRLTTKFRSLWTAARRRMHMPVRDQHQWLAQVLRGALCLLRSAEQLSFHAWLLPTGEADLVLRAPASEPASANLEWLRGAAGALSPSNTTNHSSCTA